LRLGFDPRTIRVGSAVDRVALGQSFLRVFNFPLVTCCFLVSSLFIHHPEMMMYFISGRSTNDIISHLVRD